MSEYPKRVLSLGAGVQSTALLLMMIHGEIPKADAVIFADTGWEPKIVYTHLVKTARFMAENNMPFIPSFSRKHSSRCTESKKTFASMPLYTLKPDGNKSMVRRQCTREYKIDPVNKMQRNLLVLKKASDVKSIALQLLSALVMTSLSVCVIHNFLGYATTIRLLI
jgi:3'-phosphoadenosine 5'-phosphosulfate sulfotransferase (PAPS reductase)/FAD synthetase